MSQPSDRLAQVTHHLAPLPTKVLATSFRPLLPAGLSPSYTPLNPIAFLLKAASIRPNHIALRHPTPARGAGRLWTYAEW